MPEPKPKPPMECCGRLASFFKRRWLLATFLAVLFAAGGYGAWREHDLRAAIKEAQALGWEWRYDDPLVAIRKDWKAAFRKETWTDGERTLCIPEGRGFEFERHARILRRLAPKALWVTAETELKDLSTLKGLSALQCLGLGACTTITNFDALEDLAALRDLHLHGCTGLTNVDALKGLSALQTLDLSSCTGLTNVDALKGLSALQTLYLSGCTGLTNVDALKSLTALQALDLSECIGLRNVDGLKGLPALKKLRLFRCTNLPAEAIAALQATLPNTKIVYP